MKIPVFARNVTTLMTGGVIANLLSLAAVPVISRLFNPDDFGVAALFVSITMILATVSTLRYEHAIVLPDSREEAVEITTLAYYCLFVSIVVIFGITIAWYVLFPDSSWVQTMGPWFLVIPVGTLFLAIPNIVVSLITREKKFRQIAEAEVSQVGVMSVVRIITGFIWSSTVAGLVGGLLAGNIARMYFLLGRRWSNLSEALRRIHPERARQLAVLYKQFPLYSMPTGLLRVLGSNLPVFLLAILFSPAVVGFYAMATRLIRLPMAVLGESVRRTYMQKAAELNNAGIALSDSLLKITLVLAIAGVFIFAPLFFWGGELFSIVLGEKWNDAGEYVSILTPWFLMLFVQIPPSVIYIIYQRQDTLLKIHVGSTAMIVGAFLVAKKFDSTPDQVLVMLSVIGVLTNLLIVAGGFLLAGKFFPSIPDRS
jgi:O-antigen/teichoic acid export membrane protein